MVAADEDFHEDFEDYVDLDGPGNVTVTVTGTIKTTGEGSEGILAKADGAVTITVTGNIETLGGCRVGDDCNDGISADSESGVISITLHGGTISSDHGVGVRFKGGAQ